MTRTFLSLIGMRHRRAFDVELVAVETDVAHLLAADDLPPQLRIVIIRQRDRAKSRVPMTGSGG